ncbi:MAG: hypothetical protein QOK28_3870 [Actinomycetota bacterium]|jgi:hypothetical protein
MEGFDELVSAQQGLILWSQGLEILKRRGMQRRVRDGALVKEHHGLYRVAGVPITDRLVLYGAALVCDGVGSMGAAAYFHGFDTFDVFRPVVTTTEACASRTIKLFGRDVTVHRTNCLPAEHQGVFFGVPMTTPARTMCDLSRRFDARSLGKLIDDASRRKLLTLPDVAECRDDLRARGRRRTTVLDEVLEARGLGYDPGESAPELKIRTWLEDAGIAPEVQVEVVVAGKPRRIDLAYVADQVAVEYQGLDTHGNPTAVIEDSQRTTELQLAGWLIVFVTKATGRQKTIQMVREALEQRGRRLSP